MDEILPGILEHEWSSIERKIEQVKPFSRVIHLDLLDGKFASNTTFADPEPFKKYSQEIFFELHMMVEEPIEYLQQWAEAGIRRFIGHVEKMSDQVAFVAKAQELGEVGLALDGSTPVSEITVPLSDLDTVLVYTSEKVGFSGPPFQKDRLEKVRELHQKEAYVPLTVDGGITDHTLPGAKEAGASRFVTTSYLFHAEHPEDQFRKLQMLLGAY